MFEKKKTDYKQSEKKLLCDKTEFNAKKKGKKSDTQNISQFLLTKSNCLFSAKKCNLHFTPESIFGIERKSRKDKRRSFNSLTHYETFNLEISFMAIPGCIMPVF